MATLALSHLIHDTPTFLRVVAGRLGAVAESIRRARAMAARYRALAALSDEELARRGLKRSDIAHLVFDAGE